MIDLLDGGEIADDASPALAGITDLAPLLAAAASQRDQGHGQIVTYSRKVFIPLTRLCRDVCGYCTFATTPRRAGAPYLSPDEVLPMVDECAALMKAL